MRKLILFILCFGGAVCGYAQQEEIPAQNFNKVELASVYDGDTFRVYLACRYHVFCSSIPIRVRGVDCPEIRGGSAETKALAKQAKAFSKKFLTGGKILLRNCGRDKYFRLLCDVKVNGQSLGEELLKAGHAVPYDGGTKTSFETQDKAAVLETDNQTDASAPSETPTDTTTK